MELARLIVEAVACGLMPFLIWRAESLERKLEKLTEACANSVKVAEQRETMRGVYSDINSLRERVARVEGPNK